MGCNPILIRDLWSHRKPLPYLGPLAGHSFLLLSSASSVLRGSFFFPFLHHSFLFPLPLIQIFLLSPLPLLGQWFSNFLKQQNTFISLLLLQNLFPYPQDLMQSKVAWPSSRNAPPPILLCHLPCLFAEHLTCCRT